jgi:hypothetical protein
MVKRSPPRWILAWAAASAAAGCTSIVGLDGDYELDPRTGQGGSALTGGAGPGTGGLAGGTGGTAGTGGASGGAAGNAGKNAGGSGGSGATGGSMDASAGAGGTGGAAGTGGIAGAAGKDGGSGGSGGTGGASGGSAGTTSGGASGSGAAGAGGSGAAAGTGGMAGSSGGGAAGTGGSAGAGGSTVDAGDASSDGSAGAPPDANSDAADSHDAGSPCGPGTKFCGLCVATSDPTYGCGGPTCTVCEPNGTANCVSGNCVVTGCNTGYHQVGNACVPNGPEICSNNIDDDGDLRTDCLDSDCLTNPSCVGRCMDAVPIACDTIVTGQSTNASGSTSRISSYTCSPNMYGGSEFAYRFTGGTGQRVYAEIYGLSGNLGLFQIGAPSGQQCASAGCGAYGDAAIFTGAEALGFDTVAGQDYYLVVDGVQARNYSLSVQCSTVDGCRPVKPIEAGQSFSATNNPASGASNVTASKVPLYSCAGFGESGPEAAWIFTPTATAAYRASVTSLSADCDLYVLSGVDCGSNCLGPTTFSAQLNQAPEFVTFQGVANTTYYIVVDGYLGSVCNFTIGLTQL